MNLLLPDRAMPVIVRFAAPLSDEELLRLSSDNDWLRLEREANGDLLVMSPTGGNTGKRTARLGSLLAVWAEADGRGYSFASGTGFKLGNSAVRAPDACWVRRERWDALTDDQQEGYAPVCPDFIIELTSPSDRLADVRRKVEQEWIANGVELAWLIDPKTRTVMIFRPGEEPEIHTDPTSVQGTGPILGFELVLARIWG